MAFKPEWVLNLGTYSKKKKGSQPGLDLTRATMDVLQNKGATVTSNCCDYFPTWPVFVVDNLDVFNVDFTKDIPKYGFYIVQNKSNQSWFRGFVKYNPLGQTGSLQIFDTDQ